MNDGLLNDHDKSSNKMIDFLLIPTNNVWFQVATPSLILTPVKVKQQKKMQSPDHGTKFDTGDTKHAFSNKMSRSMDVSY
jgi:hypothetical protein